MTSFQLNTFTPAEAEHITGQSVAMQRDWRKRGFLPRLEGGHARFDLFDLARLIFLKVMSDRGIGPGTVGADEPDFTIPEISATSIAYHVLLESTAYGGDVSGLKTFGLADLARSIVFKGRPRVLPGSVFLWFANGEERWVDDLAAEIAGARGTTRADGPILIVYLAQLAELMLNRTDKPFVTLAAAQEG